MTPVTVATDSECGSGALWRNYCEEKTGADDRDDWRGAWVTLIGVDKTADWPIELTTENG